MSTSWEDQLRYYRYRVYTPALWEDSAFMTLDSSSRTSGEAPAGVILLRDVVANLGKALCDFQELLWPVYFACSLQVGSSAAASSYDSRPPEHYPRNYSQHHHQPIICSSSPARHAGAIYTYIFSVRFTWHWDKRTSRNLWSASCRA